VAAPTLYADLVTEQFDDPDIPEKRPSGAAGSFFDADPPFQPPSSQPQFAPSATGFATWLAHRPDVTPALFEETMNTFEGMLVVMRDEGLRPDLPQHMARYIELLVADDDAGEADPELYDQAVTALDAYLHFRIEDSRDPEDWEDVHDVLEDAMDAHDES